jgi:hypothetical protein
MERDAALSEAAIYKKATTGLIIGGSALAGGVTLYIVGKTQKWW